MAVIDGNLLGISRVQILFCSLTWVVLTQVCSFCESSLSCKLMIYVLFCVYAILRLKGFQSLSE